ncbi:MAG: phosphate acyltransferase [Syntrophaceae bacterium]
MIRSLNDFARLAGEKGPKRMAVLAPEDEDFMTAVKAGFEKGYIEPVLIGDSRKMEEVAGKVGFNISPFEKIIETDRQAIADLGIGMLFSGKIALASKGQIPTAFIYRSIIRAEAKLGSGMTVSVISIWEVPGIDHLVAFTDTGVSINPDLKTKVDILKNALFMYRLLGFKKPRVSVLSGRRAFGGNLRSYRDYREIRKMAESGALGECEILEATDFTGMLLGAKGGLKNFQDVDMGKLPHILLVPCLDTGNILCKLDVFLDVQRCSLSVTSRGAVCIPARSDFSESILGQIAMGVAVADRMKGE